MHEDELALPARGAVAPQLAQPPQPKDVAEWLTCKAARPWNFAATPIGGTLCGKRSARIWTSPSLAHPKSMSNARWRRPSICTWRPWLVSQIKTAKRCCRGEHRGTSGSRSNCRPASTTSVASGANTKTVARCAVASWSILRSPCPARLPRRRLPKQRLAQAGLPPYRRQRTFGNLVTVLAWYSDRPALSADHTPKLTVASLLPV